MYCANCGAEINDRAVVCPKCGVPTNQQTVLDQPGKDAPNRVSGFVLGLLGYLLSWIPVVGLILSIVGVSLCSKGKKAILLNPGCYKGSGFLTAGKILGILGIIASSFVLIVTIIWGLILGEGFFVLFELIGLS